MNITRMIGTITAITLTCGTIHGTDRSSRSYPAAAEIQQTSAAVYADETAAGSQATTETTAATSRPVTDENIGTTENPCNKQDDTEVSYDRKCWKQPPEWNCPTIDPKNYQGGIMVYFDKIGMEPENARGKVQRIYCSITGAAEPVNTMKFHIFYDTRLTVKPNADGNLINPGKAVTGFTTGSAMVEEGQLVYYAYSDTDILLDHGSLFTIDFFIPENAGPGEVYPIGIAYVDDGIAYDSFLNSAKDDAGKLQMTYVFTKGIYNGYIRMLGEKTTTTAAHSEEPAPGDVNCDGEITIGDAVLLCRITSEYPCDELMLTERNFIAADYDNDDLLTILDAVKLLAYLREQAAE